VTALAGRGVQYPDDSAMCECSHHFRVHAESKLTAPSAICHGIIGSATPGPYEPCRCTGFKPWSGPRDSRTGEPVRPLIMVTDSPTIMTTDSRAPERGGLRWTKTVLLEIEVQVTSVEGHGEALNRVVKRVTEGGIGLLPDEHFTHWIAKVLSAKVSGG
jgi:hypothetical protein